VRPHVDLLRFEEVRETTSCQCTPGDGTELVAGPGDIAPLPSGHDAWVVGDEPVVVVDWFGASNYAKGD
jgi:hypothetical protein